MNRSEEQVTALRSLLSVAPEWRTMLKEVEEKVKEQMKTKGIERYYYEEGAKDALIFVLEGLLKMEEERNEQLEQMAEGNEVSE